MIRAAEAIQYKRQLSVQKPIISNLWSLLKQMFVTFWKASVDSSPYWFLKYSYMPMSVCRPSWSRDLQSGIHSITPHWKNQTGNPGKQNSSRVRNMPSDRKLERDSLQERWPPHGTGTRTGPDPPAGRCSWRDRWSEGRACPYTRETKIINTSNVNINSKHIKVQFQPKFKIQKCF